MSLLACGTACSTPPRGALVDQVGNPVSAGSPRRVVALAPDVTEIACAVGACDRLVAVSTTSNYPAQALSRPRIGGSDVEAIIAHQPDLVLATTAGNDPRVVDRLQALGMSVCTFDVTSLARLSEGVLLAGAVLGRSDTAVKLAGALDRRIAAARDRAARLPRRTALFVVWWEPLIVAAPGTFHDDLLRLAGLDTAVPGAAGRYPRVDPEVLLDPRLAVVVTPDEPDVRATFAATLPLPVAGRLRSGAVRVIWLPADPVSRPGPRLVDALEQLVSEREAAP